MGLKDPKKRKAYMKAYYQKNAEKAKAYAAKYRADHPEQTKKSVESWRALNPNYDVERYANNRESELARRKKHRDAHPELVAASNKRFRELNPEYDSNWKKSNPDKCRAYEAKARLLRPEYFKEKWSKHFHKRRALKKLSGGSLSSDIRTRLFSLQRGKCACCGERLGNDFHLDHIIPLALGGRNDDDNVQLLRSTCNLKKGAKHPIEFMQQKGYLL